MKKHSVTLLNEAELVNNLKELSEFLSFYTMRYRFDPFMYREYSQQLDRVNQLIEQMEKEKNAQG